MSTNQYHSTNSLRSAEVVVPIVFDYMQPKSVVDFGCKQGEWLSFFRRGGAEVVIGYDRERRAARGLLIDRASFRAADLDKPLTVAERFELAVCIEVAEHLRPSSAEPLVATLATVAPTVLFSAALPAQEGLHHYNERPREYWHRLFASHGFLPVDCLRPRIWQDPRVAFWYRQNIFFYANAVALARWPLLRMEAHRERARDLELVHVEILGRISGGPLSTVMMRARKMLSKVVSPGGRHISHGRGAVRLPFRTGDP